MCLKYICMLVLFKNQLVINISNCIFAVYTYCYKYRWLILYNTYYWKSSPEDWLKQNIIQVLGTYNNYCSMLVFAKRML